MNANNHFLPAREHELPYKEVISVPAKEISSFFGQGWKLFSGPSFGYAGDIRYGESITLVR